MNSEFRKISRVRGFTGSTWWYLNADCLIAAKHTMYSVEYRRFYLRDLESIVVWPNRWWLWRLLTPGVLFVAFGAAMWQWVDATVGAISAGIGLAWVLLELALGPTARARVGATGLSLELPLVVRTRRARKVLAAIDAAVRASRGVTTQPATAAPNVQPAADSIPMNSEAPSATPPVADASQTNGL